MRKSYFIIILFILPQLSFAQFKDINRSGERNVELQPIQLKAPFQSRTKAEAESFDPNTLLDFNVLHRSAGNLSLITPREKNSRWIKGSLNNSRIKSVDLKEQCYLYLEEAKNLIRSESPREEWKIISTKQDELDHLHIRMQQYYKDIPVYGGELILHAKAGTIYQMNGNVLPSPVGLEMEPGISKDEVETLTWNTMSAATKLVEESSLYDLLKIERLKQDLVIFHQDETAILCWRVQTFPNPGEKWELFIDAKTGLVIHQFKDMCSFAAEHVHTANCSLLPPPDGDEIANAQDLNNETQTIHTYETSGFYYLIDASRSMYQGALSNMPNEPVGVVWTIDAMNSSPQRSDFNYDHVVSSNNTWGHSPEGVSAHFNGGESYLYFKNVHGRESINGSGGNIISLVNVTDEDDQNMDNAFWNGAAIFYGNGAQAFEPLANALDVASHEMTHGVIQATANLEYYGESGAMNESFADIFAAMIDREDWLIGEDVVRTQVFPSGALRSLSDPHNGQAFGDFGRGWQPKHVSEKFNGPEDNNGVHINSGITNHAYYLFATAVGKDKAEKVFYRALERYLTRTSQFIDLRLAAIQASEDLYGTTEVNAAKSAFDQVGVLGEEGTAPPVDAETNEGLDLVLYSDPGLSKLVLVDFTNSLVYDPISNTDPISRPSITDDGENIVFVGADKKIYVIQIDWSTGDVDEWILQDQPIWSNVAVAKDGSRIAAVTETADNIISVFDFSVSQWVDFELYNPTYTEGVTTADVLYADAMEFDFSGEWLMYDANNQLESVTTGGINYWDIGFLRVWDNSSDFWGDGTIQKLFPALPEGVSIGNPTFSKNSPFIMAFDFIEQGDNKVLGANIETGEVAEIFPVPALGYPSYSRNDLQMIYDQNFDFFIDVGILNLQENKIQRIQGSEDILLSDARWGVWFSNGERELTSSTNEILLGIEDFHISPNPFTDQINIELVPDESKAGKIELMDIHGRTFLSQKWELLPGMNRKAINISNIPAGPLFFRLIFAEGTVSKLLIRTE